MKLLVLQIKAKQLSDFVYNAKLSGEQFFEQDHVQYTHDDNILSIRNNQVLPIMLFTFLIHIFLNNLIC